VQKERDRAKGQGKGEGDVGWQRCTDNASEKDETYSRGFFFGPGLPRGLGTPSAVRETFRFVPGAGPFRFLGGSVVVSASGAGTGVGAGVEFDSEAASAESVTFSMGAPFVAGAGEGASDGSEASSCFGGVVSSN
jgi:hypothetical protein